MAVENPFKHTDGGACPEDWLSRSLLEVVSVASGQVDPKIEPFRSMVLVAPDHIEVASGRLLKKETALEQKAISGKYQFACGDIVYSKIRPYLRKAIFTDFDGLCSADMYPLRPKPGVSGRFVHAHLLAHRFTKYAESVSVRSGMPKINRDELSQYSIVLPPTLAEQEAIANALSDADSLIESLEKLIAKKRLIKTSLLQKLFTPQKEWRTFRLGECATLKARIGWQGLTTAEYLSSGSFGLITGTDFKSGKIDWNNCHYVTKDRYDQDRNIQIKENDVLVTKDGTIGKVAFIDWLPQPTTLNSGVFAIRPIGSSFDPKCFYYLLSSHHFDEFLGQLAAGSTISHLYQKDFVHFSFKLPDLSKQQEIGSVLFELDSELAKHEERLTKARLIKQGMMQELLTGRIRLI